MNTSKVIIIGSTGSIGTQTLQALSKINAVEKRFEIVGIAAHKSENFRSQVSNLHPKAYSFSREIEGVDSAYYEDPVRMIESLRPDICVIASSGSESLRYTTCALKNAGRVCLANKESLVMAGRIIKQMATVLHTGIIPVDSEHSAVFQLIQGERLEDIETVFITASGGALRDWPAERLSSASVEDVLKHPNWNMGKKITVDSATMFNKGLEIIEAAEFFDLKKEQIQAMLSYSSYVHAVAVFKDGSVKLHAGQPNMVIPIAYALTFPERTMRCDPVVFEPEKLSLKWMNLDKYPAVQMAYDLIDETNARKIAYNAANEVAVQLFLDHKICFTDIYKIVRTAVDETDNIEIESIDEIIQFNEWIKKKTSVKWRD
ncbi:MAG TPA: 1-deoxy-D-xylulose-5-phosphate reductoisomerase [Thermotogota bacterium]|nr:1-deoxy-D-xylulose-5-phosphate reductoisomerase [Thermotogota bacterium]HRW34358.1 1-deoxy-D-xylulose-5-phosphate reductoisomerase [Thermotogota bacterium]